MKSGRSGKCENNSTLNVKKKFCQLDDQSDGQFGQFGRPGQFFRHFRVNIPTVNNPGKCHDPEGKCKMLIQEWTGGIFLGVLDVNKYGGSWGQQFKNI